MGCTRCRGGTGWIIVEVNGVEQAKRCTCQKTQRREGHLKQLPPLFRTIDIKALEPRSERQAKAWETVQKKPRGNYFFTGQFGSGKSHLMACQFLLVNHPKCHYYLTIDLMEIIREATMEGEIWIPTHLDEMDHYFLDDLTQCKGSDHREEKIFYLIDKLLTHGSGLSVTSSMALTELPRIMPGATVRRITDLCEVVSL